ncbi:MAG: DUF1501 domain-containing protein [Kineosporiaceae bacterium]|nr:DUF1501 domain-containing protein [Kineosporiaceae bacterium]MBK7624751.1 DUF1501 domain-containing protein [Kineosporiaceae bacterium]MBK8076872.1 DUF1501 domain-containing protein [Kineosporiaceae bacterium]
MTTPVAPARNHGATDNDPCACHEGRRLELSRRGILKMLGGTALVTATLGEAQLAFGATAGTKPNVLVTIVLGGGMDGMSAVVPHGDAAFAPARPNIAIPPSTTLRADAMFGLHPALSPLYPLWQSGKFGAVQAVGQLAADKSHFSAMEKMEQAATGSAARDGWVNRMMGLLPENGPLEGVALGGSNLPGHYRGAQPTLSAYRLADITLPLEYVTTLPLWQQAFTQLHVGERPEISAPMRNALGAVNAVASVPASTATGYPNNTWGTALKDVARMIKADVGLRTASVPYGGWDHHENFGGPTDTGSTFAGRLSGLAQGLAAFAADLGTDLDRVTTMTFTEFGRPLKENGSGGLDHGHGYVCLMLGGGVNGGKVHGTWPGLAPANLSNKQDLAVTTDYRSVISEVLTTRMGVSSTTPVFPGFTPAAVGVMRSV